jgi:mono/diheme cytochrome c family protein
MSLKPFILTALIAVTLLLQGCGESPDTTALNPGSPLAATTDSSTSSQTALADPTEIAAMQPDETLRAAHQSPMPDSYAGRELPAGTDEAAATERGAAIYTTYCAVCHGADGMGTTTVGVAMVPPAAPVAHTAQMMSDAYLIWRISEGGSGDPLTSGMPAWKDVLSESAIQDLIYYMRALGEGSVMAGHGPQTGGPQTGGPQTGGMGQGRDMMADDAVARGVLTAEEAELFVLVMTALETNPNGAGQGLGFGRLLGRGQGGGNMRNAPAASDALPGLLGHLVQVGTLTQVQADQFTAIYNRLANQAP